MDHTCSCMGRCSHAARSAQPLLTEVWVCERLQGVVEDLRGLEGPSCMQRTARPTGESTHSPAPQPCSPGMHVERCSTRRSLQRGPARKRGREAVLAGCTRTVS